MCLQTPPAQWRVNNDYHMNKTSASTLRSMVGGSLYISSLLSRPGRGDPHLKTQCCFQPLRTWQQIKQVAKRNKRIYHLRTDIHEEAYKPGNSYIFAENKDLFLMIDAQYSAIAPKSSLSFMRLFFMSSRLDSSNPYT